MILPGKKLRVLVVDDTIVYRSCVSEILKEIPGVEVAGVAHNGQIALAKIASLAPDLLTLDIEMPVMNGLEVLAELKRNYPKVGAIMLSTLTADGSEMTLKALELGAFDFILKPQSGTLATNKARIKEMLQPMLEAYARSHLGRRLGTPPLLKPMRPTPRPAVAAPSGSVPKRQRSEIVAIGISTGGPNALGQMLPMLPGNIGAPVLIVQHMPPVFTKSLAASLDKKCALTVKEAEEGEAVVPNVVYIAPGGKQMKLVADAGGAHRRIRITNDPPENSCKPSADYMFRSIADYYVGRTTAVIMTGMGSDGTKGLEILKNKGAYIIAQDEASCVVYGMPKAPTEGGLVDCVAPLAKIADEIVKTLR
ncbi:MAG: chemotaxis response regulator protein-glutamate methylesterase [Desulfobulbaceae bacterium]|jgi:two-component system chemotaxis response regulator CheB|nr:chemotaxis response regulator protein-glutamate methylesterase [Desulfobulbaceae bacterium]